MISESLGGRAARRGPDGRSAGRRCGRAAGGGSNGGDGTVQEEERAAKSGPMLRGPERFFRSGERGRAAVSIPGTKAAPIYIAFWRSSYASGSSRARPSASARSSEPRRARRKEGRERTLCRKTMLRTPPTPPPPPRKLFLPPSEFTAGGQESKPRGSRGPQDGGGCCRCKLFEVITLWLTL